MSPALATKRKRGSQSESQERSSDSPEKNFGSPAGLPLFLQRKPLIGQAGDAFEQEADQVEAAVVSGASPGRISRGAFASIQRKCSQCAEGGHPCPKCEEEENLQRKSEPGSDSRPRGANRFLPHGEGQPIDSQTRGAMEPALGADFSRVRVHFGAEATRSARSLGAAAYTSGRDIVFGANQYQPQTTQGRALLAHELTHVIQQDNGNGDVPAIQRRVDGDVTTMSIGPQWAHELTDNELSEQIKILRDALKTLTEGSPEYISNKANLDVLEAEVRGRGASPALGVGVPMGTVPRPAGLPLDGGYMLQPLDGLPSEVAAAIPEGKVTSLRQPATASSGGSNSSPNYQQWATPISGSLVGGNVSANAALMRSGFQAAGENSIGIVAIPRWTPSNVLARRVPPIPESLSIPGHTAVFSRVNGEITIVRGFGPASTADTVLNYPSLMGGKSSTPAEISADAWLFTKTTARSVEYPVTPEMARAFAQGLPEPGIPPAGMPQNYTFRPDLYGDTQAASNCVLWGCSQAEGALGGRVGPVNTSSSQGRLISAMKEGEFGDLPKGTGAAVVGEMSTGLKVLKVGGRVFLVVGAAATLYDIYSASPEERARTAARDLSGFAAGLAAGAAAGLVCGPGAIVCSVVLGLAFGIIGSQVGSAVGEGVYDAVTDDPTRRADNGPIPNLPPSTVCPSCHRTVNSPPSMLGTNGLIGAMGGFENDLSEQDKQRIMQFVTKQ